MNIFSGRLCLICTYEHIGSQLLNPWLPVRRRWRRYSWRREVGKWILQTTIFLWTGFVKGFCNLYLIEICNWMSKGMQDCIGFIFLFSAWSRKIAPPPLPIKCKSAENQWHLSLKRYSAFQPGFMFLIWVSISSAWHNCLVFNLLSPKAYAPRSLNSREIRLLMVYTVEAKVCRPPGWILYFGDKV